MAYSEALAERIRDALGARSDLAERKMFGGIAFLVGGNMAVGVVREDLMVRLGPDAERALAEPHVRPRPVRITRNPSLRSKRNERIGGPRGACRLSQPLVDKLDIRISGDHAWRDLEETIEPYLWRRAKRQAEFMK